MAARPLVTVAICTHDRCESLAVTLATLLEQRNADAGAYKILIVDNDSSDATPRIADRFAGRMNLHVLGEPRLGLAHARNRALRETQTEWIVFADDDLRFDPSWLAAWIDALGAAPRVSYGGGRILPDWGASPPGWFHGEKLTLIDGALGWYDLGETSRPLSDADPIPFGGNMAIRRDFALSIGGFRVDLGMKGRTLGRGEDTDFLLRARRDGAAGLYVGTALCLHRFEPRRFTPPAMFRYGVASGLAHRAIVDANASGSWPSSVAYLARGCAQLLKGRGDRFRQCLVNAGIQAGLAAHPLQGEG